MSTKTKAKKPAAKKASIKKPAAKKTAAKKTVAKKPVAKKPVVKKPVVKKSTAKKATAVKKPAAKKVKIQTEKQTKTQIMNYLSESTELSKKDIKAVFDTLKDLVAAHLKPRGSGEITLPELGVKIRRVRKPATKSRKGRNPFTGEEITIKAKPARNSVKVSALKALKEVI